MCRERNVGKATSDIWPNLLQLISPDQTTIKDQNNQFDISPRLLASYENQIIYFSWNSPVRVPLQMAGNRLFNAVHTLLTFY